MSNSREYRQDGTNIAHILGVDIGVYPHIGEEDPEKVHKLACPTSGRTVFSNMETVKIFITSLTGFYR